MCNFYTRRLTVDELSQAFGFPERPNLEPRIVVRPTNVEHVVAVGQDGGRHLIPMRWGLVPPWAKDLKTGLTTTNARSETITEKAMFAQPFRKGRRCLVVLDGFFEFIWTSRSGVECAAWDDGGDRHARGQAPLERRRPQLARSRSAR